MTTRRFVEPEPAPSPAAEDWTHASPPLEEAEARCAWLMEHRRPFGVIVGPAGTGKSRLLQMLARGKRGRLTRGHCRPIEVAGLGRRELLGSIADGLGVALTAAHPGQGLNAIVDRLRGLAECGGRQTLLLDHLEGAEEASLLAIRGLLAQMHGLRSLTILGAARPPLSRPLASLVADYADVRIELPALEAEESASFVEGLHSRSAAGGRVLPAALEELHRLSRGIPRDLERLTRLAQLAAEAEEGAGIDPRTVQGAAIEAPWGDLPGEVGSADVDAAFIR